MTQDIKIKRVVHVIYSGLGGHGAVMFGMLEAGFFKDADHVVVLTGVEPPLQDYTDRLDKLGMAWRYVPKNPGKDYVKYYRALRHEIFSASADLVFVHGLAAVPAVVRNTSDAVVLLRETENPEAKPLKDWASLGLAHCSVDTIVHLTQEAADFSERKLRFVQRKKKVHIIGNGLDIDFYAPTPKQSALTTPGAVVRFGMVARLQPNKDHMSLIAAFDRLCKARPDLNAQLEIAGDGTTREMLEADVARRGLQDKVIFHGTLSAEGVRDLLRRLDIYVHASFGETMSNSIMQAMAVGLPVIAGAVSGVTNMVTDGVGILYKSADVDALHDAMADLLDHPEKAAQLADAARAQAVDTYDARLTAKAYEDLAERVRRAKVRS